MTHPSFPAFKARYNQVRRCARAILNETENVNASDVGGEMLAELRDLVVDLNQAMHEANAYHNAMGHTTDVLQQPQVWASPTNGHVREDHIIVLPGGAVVECTPDTTWIDSNYAPCKPPNPGERVQMMLYVENEMLYASAGCRLEWVE